MQHDAADWGQMAPIRIPGLPLTGCEALVKRHEASYTQFFHVSEEDNDSACLLVLW